MARQAQEERILNLPIDVIVQKMRNVGSQSNFALRSENPTPDGGVWFRVHHGASFTSWGEKVTVTLTPMGQQTRIHIHSECGMPTQLVDGGKNAKVVRYLFDYILRPLPGQPMAAQPAPVQQVPQPTQQSADQQAPAQQPAQPNAAPQPRFCSQCGTPLVPNAHFCMRCGKPLQ